MDRYNNPDLVLPSSESISGKVGWKSPSNIALVKYWGKYGNQLPLNPSISFTLSQAYTQSMIEYSLKDQPSEKPELDFYFEGKLNPKFSKRVKIYLDSLLEIFPFLKQLKLTINTDNSFPHSSGIASSASSMSALALCLCSMEKQLFGTLDDKDEFMQKASFVARLGSGSASRSIYPKLALWGESPDFPEASNLYAIPTKAVLHDKFRRFRDDILIVSREAKSISSSDGHMIMSRHRFKEPRISQAKKRLHFLLKALKEGNYQRFGEIVEKEALTLHGMMMTATPAYLLMEPNTLKIIQEIQNFRNRTGLPVFFSLDAGPNVHMLYPKSVEEKVKVFVDDRLVKLCKNGEYIKDYLGSGPMELDFN
jgi:diphosphomevalonate decarboxylase